MNKPILYVFPSARRAPGFVKALYGVADFKRNKGWTQIHPDIYAAYYRDWLAEFGEPTIKLAWDRVIIEFPLPPEPPKTMCFCDRHNGEEPHR